MAGMPLVLQLNSANDLTITADGMFTFPTRLANGAAYSVTVLSSPVGETCTITGGNGVIAGADATNLTVNCSATSYTVGGTVSGLTGMGLILQINDGETVTVNMDGMYVFPTALADGAPYTVTVESVPSGEQCTLANASGVIMSADVMNVDATCSIMFTVGGIASGVSGAGLVLQLNGGNDLAVNMDGPFQFALMLADGAMYDVTVLSTPAGQGCVVDNASGTITGENVTSVSVACGPDVTGVVGVDDSAHSIYGSLDSGTGAFTALSRNLPFDSVRSLAYDEANNRVFATDAATDHLITVDPFFGTSTDVGALGLSDVFGLAFDPDNNVLYGVRLVASGIAQVLTINQTTGAVTTIGAPFTFGPSGSPLGLAYDTQNDVLYVSTEDGLLITVNPLTGAATAMTPMDSTNPVQGLAYDGDTNWLYGVRSQNSLIRINPGNGATTFVGAVGRFQAVFGLAFSTGLDELFGVDINGAGVGGVDGVSALLDIAALSGLTNTIGTTGLNMSALAMDQARGDVYGIRASDNTLVRMNRFTGESTIRSRPATPNNFQIRSLAFDPTLQRLYGYAIDPAGDDILVEFDLFGSTTATRPPSPLLVDGDFESLAIHTDRNLYGILERPMGDCELYRITSDDGLVLQIAVLAGFQQIRGLTFDPNAGALIGIDTVNEQVVSINFMSGATTVIGPTGTPDINGLTWIMP